MRDTKAHDAMGLLEQRSTGGHGDFAKNESYVPFRVMRLAREPLRVLGFLRGILGIPKVVQNTLTFAR